MRFIGKLTAVTLVALSVLSGGVRAATDAEVSAFLSNPSQALAASPNGGAALTSLIKDAALLDPSSLAAIIALLSSANASQQAAIGAGLGQAAVASQQSNPNYANQIQQALAASGVGNAQVAYSAVTGGGGGGGGGGGVGGPTFGFSGGTGGGGGGTTGGSTSKPGETTQTGGSQS